MQFGFTALLAAVTAAATASAQVYSGYVLTAIPDKNGPPLTSLWTTVSMYNGNWYIGEAKRDVASEPFIFAISGNGPSRVSFTSYHGVPTGWQDMYIFPNDLKAPGFTSPHSAFVPTGADPNNFTVGAVDRLFRYKNTNRWHACPVPSKPGYYNIVYVGGSNKPPKECTAVALKVDPYGTCTKV